MEFKDLLKQIDDYFENLTQEQLERDLEDVGVNEIYEYIQEDKKIDQSTLYFDNHIQYVYNKEITYDVFQKEGTRCQTQAKRLNKQLEKMALAS